MPIATADALMGLGMPAQLAALMGGNPSALTTTGTTQATAAVMKSKNTELVTAGSQTGAIPPSTAPIMEPYNIVNPTATTGVVYCPVGHYMNGTQNSSVSVAQNKAVIIWQYKKNYWCSILTA